MWSLSSCNAANAPETVTSLFNRSYWSSGTDRQGQLQSRLPTVNISLPLFSCEALLSGLMLRLCFPFPGRAWDIVNKADTSPARGKASQPSTGMKSLHGSTHCVSSSCAVRRVDGNANQATGVAKTRASHSQGHRARMPARASPPTLGAAATTGRARPVPVPTPNGVEGTRPEGSLPSGPPNESRLRPCGDSHHPRLQTPVTGAGPQHNGSTKWRRSLGADHREDHGALPA